jgi:ABC-type uncharacterized transport system ATPase subunit
MKIVNLAQKVDSKAGSLSHGQKQWLEIAMLVGQKPDLMLVDEPVAGLTDEETDLTADLIKSLSGENTVVVIDHDMEFIRRLDSNVSVLNQGTVLCEGTMETIQKDKKVIDVYLGLFRKTGKNLLEIKSLNTYYGESHILRDVDLNVKSGEMVCLIGRNGVGKTTLLKSLIGLLKQQTRRYLFNW